MTWVTRSSVLHSATVFVSRDPVASLASRHFVQETSESAVLLSNHTSKKNKC